MLDTRFYFVLAHIILYCFLRHIYDFLLRHIHYIIRIVVIVHTIVCLRGDSSFPFSVLKQNLSKNLQNKY